MAVILLLDVAKYYKETQEQNAALDYLQKNISQDVLNQFAQRYRNNEDNSKILLKNAAKYFSGTKSQIDAFSFLQDKVSDDVLNQFAILWRKKSAAPKEINLKVPFFNQLDNYRDAYRTCNSSSCAMCLEYLKPGTLPGPKGDDAYVKKVFSIGDTTDHSVQTQALRSYGVDSEFYYNLGFADIDKSLAAGKPVVIGILHRGPLSAPRGGHMIVVRGKNASGDYYINDPYGSLNDSYTGAIENGNNAVYTKHELTYRWLENGADKTGWGRIFN